MEINPQPEPPQDVDLVFGLAWIYFFFKMTVCIFLSLFGIDRPLDV